MSEVAPNLSHMPTPKKVTNKDGSVSYKVRYRLAGVSTSDTFYDPVDAQEFAGMIDAVGPERAVAYLDQKLHAHAPATRVPTLNEWAVRYIDSLTGASGSTKAGYLSSFTHSFGKHLGELPLDAIDREAIARTIGKLQTHGGRANKGYSDKSIANHHGLLSAMLQTAALDGIIATSPSARIRLPRRTEHESAPKRFLTEDEFAALDEATLPHHRPVLEAFVGTGLRWGEAEALTVADLSPKLGTLRINKAAKWSGKKRLRIIGPTKTPKSNRIITVDDDLVETLERLVHHRDPRERLFLAPRGGPLRHKVFWENVWLPSCQRAGLDDPRPRIHDLRHTHASWLIAEGVSLKAVQERLGHESFKTTMDLYAHLLPGAHQEAADAMGRVWKRRVRSDDETEATG